MGSRTITQLFARGCGSKLALTMLLLLCCTKVQALTIESGQSLINQTSVQLHLTLPTNCYQVQIQNENDTPVVFTNPTASMPWTLSSGDGQKTVKVTYSYYYLYTYQCGTYPCNPHCCSYNWLGQCTGTCYNSCPTYCQGQGTSTSSESAQITLDQTLPSLTISTPAESSHTNTPSASVSGAVSDMNGIRQLIVRGMPASLEAFNSTGVEVPLNAGANQISVVATDNAGNSQVANRIVYFDPPQNGVCGAANGQALTSAPVTDLCSVGTASTVSGSGPWNWSCAGVNGGTTADCAATLKTWTVTPSASEHGSINPGLAQTVVHGATTAFTVTPLEGYRVADVAGSCGGTLIDNTYTTNAVTADCTVEASFTPNLSTLTVNQAGAGAGTVSLALAGAPVTPHNGSLINGPAWTAGKFGNSLNLASGQYVEVPDPTGDLDITGDLTIALWVNPSTVTCSGADPAYALLSKRSANHATPYELYIGCGGTLTFHAWATNILWPNFTATGTVTTGAWQHLAVTRSYAGSNATVTFYIDGVAAGSSTLDTGPALGSSDPLWISQDGYHTTYTNQGSFSGLMDDVLIYNRALSAADIKRVYANDYASLTNRIGNWKLDETTGTTAADSTHLTCTGSCSESFSLGAVVVLTASPAAGSVFAGWGGDTDCADGSVTVAGDPTCTAIFNPDSYPLNISKTGTGTGKVTSSPAAIDCGETCASTLPPETVVTLGAVSDTGSVFTGWGGDADCADGVVTMSSSRSCTASFDTYAFTVTPLSHDFGEKVVGDPVLSSVSLTVTNSRSTNRAIQSISLAGDNAGDFTIPTDYCSNVSYAPTGWCTQAVNFSPASAGTRRALLRITTDDPATPVIDIPLSGTGTMQQYTLAVTSTGPGIGTVTSRPVCIACFSGSNADCSANLDQGTEITLTATPSNLSLFGGWSGDCSGNADCTLTMAGNRSAEARFELADKARIGTTGYESFASAYSDAAPDATIFLLNDLLPIIWTIDKHLIIHGGFNGSFDNQVGYTTLQGILTIGSGSVEADRIIVQ